MGQGSSQEQNKLWNMLEDRLLEGDWVGLFETYPVLAKRIGVTIEHFMSFIGDFLDRFLDKKEMIEEHFYDGMPVGRIEGIQGEISDLHQKGKSVLILSLDGDRRLVYKPRPLDRKSVV